MNEKENSWFYRNRTFLFVFTAVLIALYILISLLVPHQTPYSWSGEVTEYALNDDTFAEVHTLTLEGVLTSSVVGGTRFDGALTISGYPELEEMTLHLERKDRHWQTTFQDSYGQVSTCAVHEVYGTKEFENIAIDLWTSWEKADDGSIRCSMDYPGAHFLVPGSATRLAAVRQYSEYVEYALK